MNTLNITSVPLDQIKPYWRNPRKTESAIGPVVESIRQFGLNQPLVLDSSRVIIAGHVRYKALKVLGWTEAPCVVVDLSPTDAKKYRIADNKTSEFSKWEDDLLVQELRELDIPEMQPFFGLVDLEALIRDFADDVTDEDVAEASNSERNSMGNTPVPHNASAICPKCGHVFEIKGLY